MSSRTYFPEFVKETYILKDHIKENIVNLFYINMQYYETKSIIFLELLTSYIIKFDKIWHSHILFLLYS